MDSKTLLNYNNEQISFTLSFVSAKHWERSESWISGPPCLYTPINWPLLFFTTVKKYFNTPSSSFEGSTINVPLSKF